MWFQRLFRRKAKRIVPSWRPEMTFQPTTARQKELLNRMLKKALLEIRILASNGKSQQTVALTNAFHSLPEDMYSDFSFQWFREGLESYQTKYDVGTKYTDMLDKVIREEEI